MNIKLIFLVTITLICFSTSSVLARAALIDSSIDPYSFTAIRLLSGAIVLLMVLFIKEKKVQLTLKNNWDSSFMLFLYAIAFSYAFIKLDAGLGALILFAVVQLTIIITGLLKKERLTPLKTLGIVISFAGLIYLLYPTEKNIEISMFHSFLIVLSGIAWGFYTIFGKKSSNATLNTTDNFTKSLLYLVLFFLLFSQEIHISPYGATLAFVSGGITSAFGYLLWYYLLPNLKIITSGVLQLLIPPLAIFLGVFFLEEQLTTKLVFSTLVILGGIFLYLKSGNKEVSKKEN